MTTKLNIEETERSYGHSHYPIGILVAMNGESEVTTIIKEIQEIGNEEYNSREC